MNMEACGKGDGGGREEGMEEFSIFDFRLPIEENGPSAGMQSSSPYGDKQSKV